MSTVPQESLEEAERRDQPGSLGGGASGASGLLGRIRTRSKSRDRTGGPTSPEAYENSSNSSSRSFLTRMTSASSTTTTANGGEAHHHGGALDKLKGVFSNRPSSRDRHAEREEGSERNSLRTVQTGTTVDGERGRNMHKDGDYIVSTGRGGAGNLRAASRTRAADAAEPSEEELRERSRERSRERGLVGGRGGAGNFRSPSKQPADRIRERIEEEEIAKEERAAKEKRAAEEVKHYHSHGRGGAGNITK